MRCGNVSQEHLKADYLIVGAGATAMAFADTLLSETGDGNVIIVDRHHRPGGHWNDAYSFVKLHQPSSFYGVNSRPLGSGRKDESGLNQGLYELASGAEILDYFDKLMRQRLLASGRVRYFPMSEYRQGPGGEHQIHSLVGANRHVVEVARRIVNATHAQTAVPSTHPPKYAVAAGVRCVPLNELPKIRQQPSGYVVIGSGKTGMDACLWLLQNGVAATAIRWVMPRDAWLLDRANFQPGEESFERNVAATTAQLESIAAATSAGDLFERLEANGQLLRIDPSVTPTTYRCAVVSQGELAALRQITQVIRLGRVRSIDPDQIVLDAGRVDSDPNCLYVDCSASAIVPPPKLPVFSAHTINLLMVRTCQPVFSAALIAFVESRPIADAAKNALCRVVPSPEVPTDWIRMWATTLANGHEWGQDPDVRKWLAQSRLDPVATNAMLARRDDVARQAMLARQGAAAAAAGAKLPPLLASLR